MSPVLPVLNHTNANYQEFGIFVFQDCIIVAQQDDGWHAATKRRTAIQQLTRQLQRAKKNHAGQLTSQREECTLKECWWIPKSEGVSRNNVIDVSWQRVSRWSLRNFENFENLCRGDTCYSATCVACLTRVLLLWVRLGKTGDTFCAGMCRLSYPRTAVMGEVR